MRGLVDGQHDVTALSATSLRPINFAAGSIGCCAGTHTAGARRTDQRLHRQRRIEHVRCEQDRYVVAVGQQPLLDRLAVQFEQPDLQPRQLPLQSLEVDRAGNIRSRYRSRPPSASPSDHCRRGSAAWLPEPCREFHRRAPGIPAPTASAPCRARLALRSNSAPTVRSRSLIAVVTADCEIINSTAACEIWPVSAVATK